MQTLQSKWRTASGIVDLHRVTGAQNLLADLPIDAGAT
jgi:hypothetical protein